MRLPVTPTDWPSWIAIAWPLLVALLLGALVHWGLLALARHSRRHTATRLRARVAVVLSEPASVALPLLFLNLAVATTTLPARWVAGLQHVLGIGVMLCVVWLAVRAVRVMEQ